MDFQEAFLVMFWPAWVRMLGLFIAITISISLYYIIIYSQRFPRPRRSKRFAGQQITK